MNDATAKVWQPGTEIETPVQSLVSLNPEELSVKDLYKFLTGAIIPRPIALVSTRSKDGIVNLAPFSFFQGVASNPPTVSISIAYSSSGNEKDTLVNIQETGEFVVNSSNAWLAGPVVFSGGSYAADFDELEEAGLTPLASERVAPPRVKESAWQMECKVYKTMEIGEVGAIGATVLVVGEVVKLHIDAEAYNEGRIDGARLEALAKVGGYAYCKVEDTFEIPISTSAK